MSTVFETRGSPTKWEKFMKEVELSLFEKSEDGKTILSTCKDCNLSKKKQISLPTDADKQGDMLASFRYEMALIDEFLIHLHGVDFTNHYVLPPIFGEYYYEPCGDIFEENDESEDEHDESEDESGAEDEEDEPGDSGAEDERDSGAEDETGEGAAFDHKTEELLDMIEAGLKF